MGILILPDFLIDVPGEPPRAGWGVRVVGGQIDAVGANADLRRLYPDDEVVDATGQILSPGFVDAHTHLYGVLAHGIPLHKAPSGFWPFLTDFWWPLVEDRLDQEMICAATDLNLAAMLRGGVTSFYDITEAPNAIPGCLAAQAEVVAARGMRGILSFEATERVSKQNGQLGLRENLEFTARGRDRGRSRIGFHVLPYHVHLFGRVHPSGLRAGRGRRGIRAHARSRGHLRAGAGIAAFWRTDLRVLRAPGRGRTGHAGLAVRPDHPGRDRHHRAARGAR